MEFLKTPQEQAKYVVRQEENLKLLPKAGLQK
jgi:hypothetical protein